MTFVMDRVRDASASLIKAWSGTTTAQLDLESLRVSLNKGAKIWF
jgi:hypothetical protein